MESSSATPSPSFQVQKLYIKDSQCKVPHAPAIFKETWKPTTSLEIQVKQQLIEPLHYEVIFHLSATTKLQERTAFQIDIQQAGIFKCEGFEEAELTQLLSIQCPAFLYPYLCRAVADAAVHAGFPPLLLTPIDFVAMYQQQALQTQNDQTSNHASTVSLDSIETIM